MNRFLFYGVLALLVLGVSIFVTYTIICFIKHGTLLFDMTIFTSWTLWSWVLAACGVAFVGVIGFSIYYDLFNHTKLLNKNETAKSDVYGKSRFLTDKEIADKYGVYDFAKLGEHDVTGCIIQSERVGHSLRLSMIEKQHALISGVSGDGKSLRHLGMTIQANAKSKTKPSMLINDIKGELWNMHSKFLKEQGYETILLDLRNPYGSYRLNPINIIWKLKERAENMPLELTNDELDEYYFIYKSFRGDLSAAEFSDHLTNNGFLNVDSNIDKMYNDYKKATEKIDFSKFPAALGAAPFKWFIKFPDGFNELSESERSAKLFHLYIDKYKFFLKAAAGLSRDDLYKGWQTTQIQKKMSMLNRMSALVLEFGKQIVPTGTGENKQWADGAQGICTAVLLAMLEDGFSPELNFTEEMYSITQISNIVNRQRNELNDFLKLREADSKVFDFAGMIIDNAAEKTVAGYMSNLQTPLKDYLEDGIEYMMSGNDVDFNDIIAKPTAIFILIPEAYPARNIVASMYITQIYNELLFQSEDFAELNYLLPRPFYFLWDEFGNSAKIPTLPSWVTLSRSRNIYFTFYVQGISQITNLYGENDMKTLVQNCHLQIIMGTNEDETVEHFRKMFGERTVVTRSANFDPHTDDIQFKGSSSLSKVDLVPPDFLRTIESGTIYWKVHKVNPGKTHIEHIMDNKDILSIGTYDKPAEQYKPYDKSARIYDVAARNKYVKEINELLRMEEARTKPGEGDNAGGGNGGGDSLSSSIPVDFDGYETITPEELGELNEQRERAQRAAQNKKPGGGGGGTGSSNSSGHGDNPHMRLFDDFN